MLALGDAGRPGRRHSSPGTLPSRVATAGSGIDSDTDFGFEFTSAAATCAESVGNRPITTELVAVCRCSLSVLPVYMPVCVVRTQPVRYLFFRVAC